MSVQLESFIARIIAAAAFVTTVVVMTSGVTDPVNAPKFVSLGIFSFAAFGAIVMSPVRNLISQRIGFLIGILLFFAALLNSVINSDSPLVQNLYGSYGRNNGLLTYLFLGILLALVSTIQSRLNIERILRSLVFAGLVNLAYGGWVLIFGDFVGWTNPYGNILGTFGNPNFIGSFLGIFLGVYLVFAFRPGASRLWKQSCYLVAPVTVWEILESHAIQGRVLAALSLSVIGFYYIKSNYSRLILLVYTTFVFFGGFIALLGALQKGPLVNIIYKTSVSLRGQYWLAGWNTGEAHPLTGVGMDAFGDWYRRMRDPHAIELPGVNTVVNAAHNVPMDMFAFGGWPLLLTYMAVMFFGALAIVRLSLRFKKFDWVQVGVTCAWLCYQVQSLISINQIGLAIWGWVLNGILIAYEITTRSQVEGVAPSKEIQGNRAKKQSALPQSTVGAFAFGLLGLMLALPPLSSDIKWRSAQEAQSVDAIKETMKPTYFNPLNSTLYLMNIQALEQSKFSALAHQYALEAVLWNPESFDLWRALYFSSAATPEEKSKAAREMKRLDPLNPDVTATQ